MVYLFAILRPNSTMPRRKWKHQQKQLETAIIRSQAFSKKSVTSLATNLNCDITKMENIDDELADSEWEDHNESDKTGFLVTEEMIHEEDGLANLLDIPLSS
jgi:predicted transcriptional regulator